MFRIYDWAGNKITTLTFATFLEGWDYIYGPLTERLDLTEEDYQEYEVHQ